MPLLYSARRALSCCSAQAVSPEACDRQQLPGRLASTRSPDRILSASILPAPILALLSLATLALPAPAQAAGQFSVEIVASPNFVVDSNVTSPSTYAPEVATISGRACNTGDAPLTGVQMMIGDNTAGTPGTYPTRDSASPAFATEHPQLAATGLYSLTHIGAVTDATRWVGDLAPGECSVQYWHFTYPKRGNPDNTGAPVWGATNVPEDDLWLEYDVWATSAEGPATSATKKGTMRNEISANANKIFPNGGNWFNTNADTVEPGETVTSNGINYILGVVNKGFDNDGDLEFDYNAWLQPIGDPSFDPTCLRLVKTWGTLTISRSGGNPDLVVNFEDQLYFQDLPPDNNGVVGEVHYQYLALRGGCSVAMSPYQEAASGADNEKFAGDFGVGLPKIGTTPAEATFDKTVDLSEVSAGGTLSYSLITTNTGAQDLGLPGLGMPIVLSDSIPADTAYVAGSASITLGYAPSTAARILYSTDGGLSWSTTEPAPASDVTDIQWWLSDPLPPAGSVTADFDVLVDSPFGGAPFIENTGSVGFGGAPPFLDDSTVTLVLGTNSVGDTVWRDDDMDGVVDGGELGIQNVDVELWWDQNGDGALDAGDVLVRTATTGAGGAYSFTNLPDGDFLVRVDKSDPDFPFGFTPTTDEVAVGTDLGGTLASPWLDADFGYVPSLLLTKTLITLDPALEGQLVTFDVSLTNTRGPAGGCQLYDWGPALDTRITSGWDNQGNVIDDPEGPNGTHASAGFGVQNPGIGVDGFDFGSQNGSILKVELLYPIYLDQALVDDFGKATFPDENTNTVTVTLTTAQLNNYVTAANAGTLAVDVTAQRSWSWSAFTDPDFFVRLENEKVQSADGSIMFLDAIGIRVTADSCSGPGADTISPLPLSDVFDADLLQFVQADVAPTSLTFGATPFANTGTLSWSNVGPLAGGQSKTFQITFRALQPPDGDSDGEPDPASTINTASSTGATFLNGDPVNDASDTASVNVDPAGTIGDTVFDDNGAGGGTYGNGVQEGGEPGIPNVTVELWSDPNGNGDPTDDGTLVATQQTDASGSYLFEAVSNGNWVVVVSSATLPGSTFTATGDPDEVGVCVTCDDWGATVIDSSNGSSANDDDLTLDFGYIIPNTVFGTVWNDHDSDTTQDAGENGIDNVTIQLLDCGPDAVCGNGDDGATRTTTTASDGSWLISDLPNGNYQAVVDTTTLPTGGAWSQTVDPDATMDDRTTATLVLANGSLSGSHDFAYAQSGSSTLGDTLYVDWNGDGDQDSGEEGIAAVTVWLYEDANGDGSIDPANDALVATTTTAGDGSYSFTNLPAGNWIVVVDPSDSDLPSGATLTDDPDESGTCALCDGTATATTDGSNTIDTLDFGYTPTGTGSIGDTVFQDNDGDGILDSGEVGIDDIRVVLYEDSNGNGTIDSSDAVVDIAFTDSSGSYLFGGLAAGRYLVDVEETDTDLPVDGNGNRYTLSSDNDEQLIVLAAGENRLDADFGFAPGGTIGNAVWRDDDRDSLQDEQEPGIPNVTVTLYVDTNGNGVYDSGTDTQYATTVTDANGEYQFLGLPADDYVVVLDTADTDLPSSTVTGDPDEVGACTVCDGEFGVALQAGRTILFADFGVQSPGVVGDRVWLDSNADGVYDPVTENGLYNVQIDLLDATMTVIATTITDSDGGYNFGQLADGNYTVRIQTTTLPPNVVLAFDPDEGNNCAVCDHQGSVSIAGGNLIDTIDFGYRVGAATNLTIQKTSSANGGPVNAGDVILYTIVVTNTGTSPATQVVVSDPVPQGASYVPGSASVTGPISVPSDYRDDFTSPYPGAYNGTDGSIDWSPQAWAEISDDTVTTTGDVSIATDLGDLSMRIARAGNGADRGFDLTGAASADISLETRRVGFSASSDYVAVEISYNGGTSWAELGRFAGPGTDAGYVAANFSLNPATYNDGNPADNRLRLLSYGLQNNGSEVFWADAVTVTTTTRQIQVAPGRTPPLVVAASDGYSLWGGESMTVTLQVQVQNPPPAGISQILNQAGAVSVETIEPVFDLAIDKLATGGALGDRVWLDTDGDGIQDIGEPGLANVELVLWDAGGDGMPGGGDDTQVGTTLSDLEGGYLFSGLGPGIYYVEVNDATLPAGLGITGTATDPSPTRVVTASEQYRDLDFGYTPTDLTAAAIGDRVWSDGDGDGVQDPGEPGIEGVTVNLKNSSGTIVDTATTGPDGSYLFTSVTPGDYTVEIDPADLLVSGLLDGYSPTSGPQSIGGSTSPPLTVLPGDVYLEADFGYDSATTYTITDRVWFDANANGLVDLGENGIDDVSVNLLDDQGNVIATTASSEDGTFSFDGVAPGSYTIQMADNKLELLGLTGTSAPALAYETSVLVTTGDVTATNFGYNVPGAVGDRVWSDADGDGVQDPGEPGIAGVTVTLWRDVDQNGVFDATIDTLQATTITDASGWYRFEGLAGDTWFASIVDTQPALTGYSPTTTDQETGPNAAGTQIEAVLVSAAAGFLDADFGYQNGALADISGNVFNDLDLDGVDDGAGEPGFASVTLELVDTNGVVVATAVTDANGDYTFFDLPAADYLVRVSDDEGVLRNAQLTSGTDQLPVSLGASDVTGVDFGYNRTEQSASIGDRLWFDADRDGIEDASESGVSQVTVGLYLDDGNGVRDAGDTLVATTSTDSNGLYRFGGLAAGTYFVDPDETTLPTGFAETSGTGGASAAIPLSDAADYDLADFGYAPSVGSSIGDTVFFDANGNGYQDPGEIGIAGVDLTITGPGGYNTTVTTGADGRYLATGVTASGQYQVALDTATLPAGLDPQPTNFLSTTINFGVTAGIDWLFADYGFQETVPGSTVGSIGDLVFVDVNGNGVFDGDDFGLEGVTLDLRDGSGTVIAGAVTDANGAYDFSGLFAADYTVDVTDMAGVLSGLNLSAGADPTATLSLGAGQDYNDADFGYSSSGGLGAIGDLVWHDVNDDGDVDAGESGIEGVTLRLWHDVNANGVLDVGIDNLLRDTVTDLNGEYFFNGLPVPASYLVELTDVVAVLEYLLKTTGLTDVNDNSQANPHPVTLTASRAPVRAPVTLISDFGFSVSGTPYTISGTTYFDNDGDGTLDPPIETGIQSVAVFLFRDLDGDGVLDPTDPLFGSTLSAVDGTYSFPGLPDNSDWIVAVDTSGTFLAGSLQTTQLGTNAVQPVSIAGADRPNQDFGFTRPPTAVLLSRFEARRQSGSVVVEWDTTSEAATLGFDLYREDPNGEWQRVNHNLVLALPGAYHGAHYRVLDPDATAGVWLRYVLVELEVGSSERVYGPFTVQASETVEATLTQAVEARASELSAADRERLSRLREAEATAPHRHERERTPVAFSRVRLDIDRPGLHRIPAEELAVRFGLTAEEVSSRLTTGTFRLLHRSGEVGWFQQAGDLFFWAEEGPAMSAHNTYMLELGGGISSPPLPGVEIVPRQTSWVAVTERAETDVFGATAAARNPDEEFWFWAALVADHPSAGTLSLEVSAPGLAEAAHTAIVTLDLYGATESLLDVDHALSLMVNGSSVGSMGFDGLGARSVSFSVPSDVLNEGANTIELGAVLPEGVSSSIYYLDAIELRYLADTRLSGDRLEFETVERLPVVLVGISSPEIVVADVTDPVLPRAVEFWIELGRGGDHAVGFMPQEAGQKIHVAAVDAVALPRLSGVADHGLHTPPRGGSEYLVIAPPSLLAGAQRLADFHSGRGLTTRVVTLQEIYDDFAQGLAEPEAVRRFLSHGYLHWQVRPRYAVLLGAGSFDYRDTLGFGTNLVPPLLISTPHGLYASDVSLGDLLNDDGRPEVIVGRLPVLTEEELDLYIDKLEAYQQGGSVPGDGRVLLLADDADGSGEFADDSDLLLEDVPEDREVARIYLDQVPLAEAQAELAERLDQGLVWLNYLGHGGLDRFAAEGLLTTADVASLTSQGRLPLVTSLTCSVGRFEVPGFTSLSEALALAEDRAAIAVWGPSGLSVHGAAVELDRSLARHLYDPQNATLGDAVKQVLSEFPYTDEFPHLPRIYNLIGDPALPLDAFQQTAPPNGPTVLFADDFESGDTSRWQ